MPRTSRRGLTVTRKSHSYAYDLVQVPSSLLNVCASIHKLHWQTLIFYLSPLTLTLYFIRSSSHRVAYLVYSELQSELFIQVGSNSSLASSISSCWKAIP